MSEQQPILDRARIRGFGFRPPQQLHLRELERPTDAEAALLASVRITATGDSPDELRAAEIIEREKAKIRAARRLPDRPNSCDGERQGAIRVIRLSDVGAALE